MVDNVPPRQVWEALAGNPDARLVDVRTDAEWSFVGIPDLTEAGQQPVLLAWQLYPTMQVNGGFIEQMRQAGIEPRHHVYFLCRTGGRSLAAANAARAAGYANVFNIDGGFEGGIDADGHRSTTEGWKADGLPWRQR